MKSLLYVLFILTFFSPAAFAQRSCTADAITLKAKIAANPSSVLYSLGDALALNPDCISEFIETAITAANPSPETLTQIIHLAVTEYPNRSAEIAEAAVIASPDQIEVIRKAFDAPKNVFIATPVVKDGKENPVERFPASYQTSKPYDQGDAANQATEAIDHLIARIEDKPENLTSETLPADAIPDTIEPKTRIPAVEEFKFTDSHRQIGITTLSDEDHRDEVDETVSSPETVTIEDPVESDDMISVFLAAMEKEEKEAAPQDKKLVAKKEASIDMADARPFNSSVYHIPSPADSPGFIFPTPVIRGHSISPTLPRPRIR